MDKWDVTLAQMLKDRDNPKPNGVTVGSVISGLPDLRISLGGEIVLDADQVIIANRLYHLETPLASGDEVILLPNASGQIYVVIDKAGE